MKQLYRGPKPAENADVERLVQDGVLEPVNKAAAPVKAGKADETRAFLLTVMSEQDADDLLAHRKAKKCPLTRRAAEGLVKHFRAAEKMFGWSIATCIDHMASQGWQGFDENWVANSKAQAQAAMARAEQAERGGKYARGRASDAAARLMRQTDGQAENTGFNNSAECLPADRKP